MTTDIQVKDAMIKKVLTATPGQTIHEASKMMKDQDVGSLIICEGKKPVGIITREDIVLKVAAEDKKSSEVKVKDIMTTNLVTITPEDDLADAARMMTKYGFERLPVVSLDKLIGIISDREIAKICPAAIEILRERLMLKDGDDIGEKSVIETTSGDCELCGNYKEVLKNIGGKWVCETCKEEAAEI